MYGFVDDQGLDGGILAHKGGVIGRDGVAETGDDHNVFARGVRPVRSIVAKGAAGSRSGWERTGGRCASKDGLSIADLLVGGNQRRRLEG